MVYSIVDLGSNSIRLTIYKVEEDGITQILNKKVMAGLAAYVYNGFLLDGGIGRAIEALLEFKDISESFGIDELKVFATASLRDISNSKACVSKIKEQTQIDVDVISGEEEARLDFIGSTYFLPMDKGILIDVGGASTELVKFSDAKIDDLVSMPFGSLSLYSRFVTGLLPTNNERKTIKKYVLGYLDKNQWQTQDIEMICGVGGTIRTALKLCKEFFDLDEECTEIPSKYIKKLTEMLKDGNPKTYHLIYKIVPERLFTILPGIIIIREIIKKFRIKTIIVSKNGVREGYLIDKVLKMRS